MRLRTQQWWNDTDNGKTRRKVHGDAHCVVGITGNTDMLCGQTVRTLDVKSVVREMTTGL